VPDGHQLTHGGADAVRARFGALGKDAHSRPIGVTAGVPGSKLHTLGVDAIEHEHDLDVGDPEESLDGLLAEQREVELDRAVHAVPVIVDRCGPLVVDDPDRRHLEFHVDSLARGPA